MSAFLFICEVERRAFASLHLYPIQVMRKVEYQGSTRVVVKCNNDREYGIPQVTNQTIDRYVFRFPGPISDFLFIYSRKPSVLWELYQSTL